MQARTSRFQYGAETEGGTAARSARPPSARAFAESLSMRAGNGWANKASRRQPPQAGHAEQPQSPTVKAASASASGSESAKRAKKRGASAFSAEANASAVMCQPQSSAKASTRRRRVGPEAGPATSAANECADSLVFEDPARSGQAQRGTAHRMLAATRGESSGEGGTGAVTAAGDGVAASLWEGENAAVAAAEAVDGTDSQAAAAAASGFPSTAAP